MKMKRARQVAHYHMTLESGVDGAPLDMAALADVLVQAVQDGRCVSRINNERQVMGFVDAQTTNDDDNNQYLTLLALIGDADGADPVAVNPRDLRAFNRLEINDNNLRCTTAHILIDLSPTEPHGLKHAVLIEVAVGLGKSQITPALQRHVKAIAHEHGFTVARAPGDEVIVKPRVTLDLCLDENMAEAARHGRLKSIILYGEIEDNELDPPPGVMPTRKQLTLKVGPPAGGAIDFLNRVVKPWALGHQFTDMYVKWETADQPADGAVPSAGQRLSLAVEDVGAVALSKRHVVNLDDDLPEGQADISDELIAKMMQRMRT